MTKKLLKGQQNEAREIVKQIFNLALAVNPNDTTQDKTGNKPTVSVRFSGFIAGVEVRIYPTGWDDGALPSPQVSHIIYLDDESFTACADEYEPYPEEKECEQLSEAKAALAELKRIAEEWGVDVCRRNPCAPTCPNADPDLFCARCDEKIIKGSKYFTAIDYNHRWAAFCSEDCLKQHFDIEEEEA